MNTLITPQFRPIPPHVAEILARHGHPAAWINEDDGDPHSPNNIARAQILACEERIPWRFGRTVLNDRDHAAVLDWTRKILELARENGTHFRPPTVLRGPSVLLLGRTGTGKTHTAYAAIRELACTGVRCNWVATSGTDLYASLRPQPNVVFETEFTRYAEARLLILDDLGAAKGSEFVEEVNYRLINHRYEAGLPMIVTSNLEPAQLADGLGDRVASRLRQMCTSIPLKGDDRRSSIRDGVGA